jgi:hypothetical protein
VLCSFFAPLSSFYSSALDFFNELSASDSYIYICVWGSNGELSTWLIFMRIASLKYLVCVCEMCQRWRETPTPTFITSKTDLRSLFPLTDITSIEELSTA